MVLLQEQQRQLSKDSNSDSNGGSSSSSVKCSFLFKVSFGTISVQF
jgi:hypothetical protein